MVSFLFLKKDEYYPKWMYIMLMNANGTIWNNRNTVNTHDIHRTTWQAAEDYNR